MAKIPPIAFAGFNGGQDWAILTGKSPIYQYQDKKRLSDTPIGWRFKVALQGYCFSTLDVKINESADPLPDIDESQITEACAVMKPIFVRFTDCFVSVYDYDGIKYSGNAKGIALANSK